MKLSNMRWAGHVGPMMEISNSCKILTRPEGKIQFRRLRRKWDDNIEKDIKN
jgi:hypothetical protein